MAVAGAVVVLLAAAGLMTVVMRKDDGAADAADAHQSANPVVAPPCSDQSRVLVSANASMWQSVVDAYAARAKAACQPIELSEVPADQAAAATALAGSDAWIAEDVTSVSRLAAALPITRTDVVARTPLVLVSGGLAQNPADLRNPPSPLSVEVASPLASPASALGLDALTMNLTGQSLQILGSLISPSDADRRVMATVSSMRIVNDVAQTLNAPLPPDAVVLTTEALAWQSAAGASDGRDVMYLQDGALQLQAPLVQLGASDAVEGLRAYLGTPDGAAALLAAGLRPATGTGAPAKHGRFSPIAALPAPRTVDPAQIEQHIGTFALLATPVALLAAMDMSGSMADPLPGAPAGLTKIEVLRQVAGAVLGVALPTGRSGMITFQSDAANRSSLTYAAPMAFNGDPGHAQAMSAALAGTPAGGTPLYNTVVYAYQKALENYAPGMPNQLLVLTDGDNRDTVDTITLAQMTQQVRSLVDPNRPIQVTFVALGADADARIVTEMAQAAQGRAILVPDYASYGAAVAQLFSPSL